MAQPEPGAARAVVIGVQDYTYLDPLPAVGNNVHRMAALLRDPDLWGLPEAHSRVVLDPPSEPEVLAAVHEAAAAAEDAFLLYFAGHGLPHKTDGLHLALPDTQRHLAHTALSYDRIRQVIVDHCKARHKVVILDTCFSGRALTGVMGPADVADLAEVDGTFLMTSSAENRMSMAPPGAEFTLFTGELVRVLHDGVPEAGELLDMEGIYWSVYRALYAAGAPLPQQRARNAGGHITFVRNRARAHDGRSVPQQGGATGARTGPAAPVDRLLHETVPEIVERLVRLGAGGDDGEAAGDLLDTVAAHWPEQRTAVLLCELHDQGRESDLRLACRAVVRRPPEQTAECAHVLLRLGAGEVGDVLLEAVSRGAPPTVAAVARHLSDRGVPVAVPLVRSALAAAGPGGAADLVVALGRQGLEDECLSVLRHVVEEHPAPEWVATADLLLQREHPAPAYLLYAAVPKAVLDSRSPAEFATLLRAMAADDAARVAQRMLRALLAGAPAEEVVGWALTLHAEELDWIEAQARDLLGRAPVEQVLKIMEAVRRRGDANLLLLARWACGVAGAEAGAGPEAGAGAGQSGGAEPQGPESGRTPRSADDIVRMATALHRRYGMPLDAVQLLEDVAGEGPRRLAGLVVALRAERPADAARLLEHTARCPIEERVETMATLARLGDTADANGLLTSILARPAYQLLPVLPPLAEEVDAETLLGHVADSARGKHLAPVFHRLWRAGAPGVLKANRLLDLLAGREGELLEDTLITLCPRRQRRFPDVVQQPFVGAPAHLSAALPWLSTPTVVRIVRLAHRSDDSHGRTLTGAVGAGVARLPLARLVDVIVGLRKYAAPEAAREVAPHTLPPLSFLGLRGTGPAVWALGELFLRHPDAPTLITELSRSPEGAQQTAMEVCEVLRVAPPMVTAATHRLLTRCEPRLAENLILGLPEREDLHAVLNLMRAEGLSRGDASRLERRCAARGLPYRSPAVRQVLQDGTADSRRAPGNGRGQRVFWSAAKFLKPVDLACLLITLYVEQRTDDIASVFGFAFERTPLESWLPDVLAGLGGARLDRLVHHVVEEAVRRHKFAEVEKAASALEDDLPEYADLLHAANARHPGKLLRWLSR